ncbi:MAG TPA: cytochrome c3 family protein [Planctomycetota bacterium]|nr:cytochrome c3 family protein [Planctomycetota bacterium]
MKLIRWLLPIASLGLVLTFTLWDLRRSRTGPGPLHPAHAGLTALAQGTNCEACHRSGAGIDAQACTHCHADIGAQQQAQKGLHGSLPPDQLARCERCHSEHHGDGAPLIAAHAFARAGVPDPAAYDHRHVSFHLSGAHGRLLCVHCHNEADSTAPSVHERFLGLSQQCGTCHVDEHRGAFGSDCESCHGQERPWAEAPKFPHAVFALAGPHAKVGCAACHESGSAHDVAVLRRQSLPPRACGECHADPHVPAASGRGALHLANTADCARCHAVTAWRDARPTAAAHASLGFALRGAHAAVDCAACHGDAARTARWSGPAPAPTACATCHEHPHGSDLMALAEAAPEPAGCAGCHVDTDAHFAEGRLTAAQHAATGFALVAPHADVACVSCHRGAVRSERFPGRAPADCRSCHRDVHAGQFAGEPGLAQCTACHAETHFLPHQFGVAAHGRTTFPLSGAHDAVACTACHREVVNGVRTFHGTARDCAACHADVHRGTFDRAGRPKVIEGRTGCARCHDTAAFAPALAGFDHSLWAGYELAGAHAELACAGCHRSVPAGPRLGKAAGSSCASCHQDPHAGQFAAGGTTDCARCHGPVRWQDMQFDHDQQSRFALDRVHARLACSKCHLGYETSTGTIVRYKPLGVACGDCHRLGAKGEVLK